MNAPVAGIPNVLTLNTELAPTNDIAIRQALNYGIDKQTIISTLLFDLNPAAYGPLSAATLGYDASLKDSTPRS